MIASLSFSVRRYVPVLAAVLLLFAACSRPAAPTGAVTRAPEWSRDAVIYEVNVRQFSPEGTFAGVEAQLPRLKELGVSVLWLMPVHPIGEFNRKGGEGSYYAVKDYLGIHPGYGTPEDFTRFVKKAHELGMKVIIDWVANHTAWDNPLTETHPDWYTRDAGGNFTPPVADWADVIDLDYSKPELRTYMIDAMKFWVQTYDIDGFRCDVAMMVPTDFWNAARAELDKIKPVYMLAEAEQADHQVQAFDLSYGWKMHQVFNKIAKGEDSADAIDSTLAFYNRTFPQGHAMMLFTSNHDENSWSGTEFERMGPAADVMFVIASTLPGVPLIYTGQESALNRRLAFFEKDPVTWGSYEKATFFSTLTRLKHTSKALGHGDEAGTYQRYRHSEPALYAFTRARETDRIIVVTNLSGIERPFFIETGHPGTYENAFTGAVVESDGTLQGALPAWGWLVLKSR